MPALNLIGAGAHFFTYCTSATSLQLIAEESGDNVSGHFVPISIVYGVPPISLNGNPCAVIQAGGYYNYLAINVLSISGGSVSVWYSGSSGPIGVFPPAQNSIGATTPVVCDQSIVRGISANSTSAGISGTSNQAIYVCGITVSFNGEPTGASSFTVEYGTGGSCGTGTQILVTTLLNTTSPTIFPIGGGSTIFRAPTGNSVCLVAGPTVPAGDVTLSYAQF